MISLPVKGSEAKKLGANFAPLKVEAQATPNMTVTVAEGSFWTADNEHMEYIGGTSPTISSPTINAKWVLITVKSTGMLNVVDGVASSTPTLPDPSTYKDELPLAAIFVGDTTLALTNDMIYDVRPLWAIPPDSVSQSQLNDFATITYVDNGLTLKADESGTANANFTLNVGGSNINDSGLYVDRFGGGFAAIRFNETASVGSPAVPTPLWEFSNDGSTWNPIGVASGSYYTKLDLDNGALDVRYFTQNDLNVAGTLDSRYYTQTLADVIFSIIGHQHTVGDITGLQNPVLTINNLSPVSGDVQLELNDLNDVTSSGEADKHVLIYNTGAGEYQNGALQTDDLFDIDTTTNAPLTGQVLSYTGAKFINDFIQKADIVDLVESDYVQTGGAIGPGMPQNVFGVKTFKDGIVVESSFTVTGSNTTVNTKVLNITDPFFDINTNESQNGVGGGTGTAGFRISRGPNPSFPLVSLHWDETATQWEINDGNISEPILTPSKLLGQLSYTQISDFGTGVTVELANNSLNTLSDVAYLSTPSTGDYLRFGVTDWENKSFSTDVGTEVALLDIDTHPDVAFVSLAPNDFFRFNGINWENKVLVKLDVTDFVEVDYIHTTGNEVKVGDFTLDGDFTIGGTNVGSGSVTTINSESVNIKDNRITLNYGETGAGATGGTVGIDVDRGTEATVSLWWSEPGKTWNALHDDGVGNIVPSAISFVGHQHVVNDITDLTVSAADINTLTGITLDSGTGTNSPVQTQIINRISRQGDVMDINAALAFSGTGEVIGLPAVPLSVSSATSKAYVDGIFNPHIANLSVHITPDQNTFLDGLTLPTLTSGEVNQLIGIGGNVQVLLNAKADKAVPVVANNIATLDGSGNLLDSGLALDDAGTTVNDIWSADKIDTVKLDKVPGSVGNLTTLDGSGNLLDSGLALDDAGTTVNDIWSADKIDTTKVNKVSGTAGNIATLNGAGDLLDGGVSPSTFAPSSHTHVVADVTDFSSKFTSELALNNLSALGDVTNNPPTSGDILQWNGSIWDDVSPTSLSVFVKATGNVAELITGEKTFQDNTFFQQSANINLDLTVNRNLNVIGNIVVQGDQIIQGDEVLSGNRITLNYASSGAISAHAGGLILERFPGTIPGSPPAQADNQAVILWDETTDQRWKAGVFNTGVGTSSINNVALEQITVAQPLYDIQTGTGNATYVIDFNGVAVPSPAFGFKALQIFVNGIKQIEGATQAYIVDFSDPLNIVITFNVNDIPSGPGTGSPVLAAAAIEFYGFGYIN